MATEKPNQKPVSPQTPMDRVISNLTQQLQSIQQQWQQSKAQLSQNKEATEALEKQVAIQLGQSQALQVAINNINEEKKAEAKKAIPVKKVEPVVKPIIKPEAEEAKK